MTLSEAIVEVYEATDEQSDWDPYTAGVVDLTKAGSIRIARLLRVAQNAIAVWKFPGGRRLRFRFMLDQMISNVTVMDDIKVASGGTYPGFVLPLVSAPAFANDALAGSTVFIDSEPYEVVSNVGNAVSVARSIAVDPADETTLISSQNWSLTLPASKELIQVVSVYDIESDSALERGSDQERFLGGSALSGTPSTYLPTPSGVMFDVCPDSQRFYKVLFQRYPLMPTTASGVFELPLAYHDAVCEYAKYTANLRIGKAENAQLAWSRLQSLMASIRLEADLEEDFVDKAFDVTSIG